MAKRGSNSSSRSNGVSPAVLKGNNLNFSAIPGAEYKPNLAIEREDIAGGYVSWGQYNNFPEHIWEIYSGASTLQSVLNGSADFTSGDGKIFNNCPFDPNKPNKDGDTLSEVIDKCILDRWVFGGWAVQVLYDREHNMNQLIHLDLRRLRVSKDRRKFFYSHVQGCFDETNYSVYPCFDPNKTDELSQVFYWKGKKTRGVYPVSDWSSALISGEIQMGIQKFHSRTLINNFVANGILNFYVGDVTDPVKAQTEELVKKKFCSPENAAQILIAWNKDKDHKLTYDRIPSDDFDKKYEALSKDTKENIFISLRAMPVLFGLNITTGFSNQEYDTAYTLYDKTAVSPKSKETVDQYAKIFHDGFLTIEPFKIVWPEQKQDGGMQLWVKKEN